MDVQTIVFEKPGPGNTEETLRLAGEWSRRLHIRTFLVASTSGDTGLKAAVEIALMAADAGLVSTDRDVISIGGTGSGADTAVCIHPANVSRFFDVKVRGIFCKPWDY
jgi:hypothetical protein